MASADARWQQVCVRPEDIAVGVVAYCAGSDGYRLLVRFCGEVILTDWPKRTVAGRLS